MATLARKSSAPAAARGKFDAEVDIIAVGSGVAGLATALFACWHGNKVLVLEKASQLGGTTTQGGVLVLGTEQRGHARRRHQRSKSRLHPLYGAAFAARNV